MVLYHYRAREKLINLRCRQRGQPYYFDITIYVANIMCVYAVYNLNYILIVCTHTHTHTYTLT